jgi:TRAP-type C4-dicarboxylate transport system permease small subunit
LGIAVCSRIYNHIYFTRTGVAVGSLIKAVGRISAWMDNIGGTILVVMMMLTVVDVVLRILGHPLTGTYELVAIAGALVVGFAVPQTSQENGHIGVDALIERLPPGTRVLFFVVTKAMGSLLCFGLAWYLLRKGNHLLEQGDVSHTLGIPAYPGAYALAFCFLVEAVVLLLQMSKRISGGER